MAVDDGRCESLFLLAGMQKENVKGKSAKVLRWSDSQTFELLTKSVWFALFHIFKTYNALCAIQGLTNGITFRPS